MGEEVPNGKGQAEAQVRKPNHALIESKKISRIIQGPDWKKI